MTIITCELSSLGVVMAADSAITSTVSATLRDGSPVPKFVRRGANKICPVPDRPWAISYWGMGRMGDVPTDLWLHDFMRHATSTSSLDELGDELAREANDCFFWNTQDADDGGFHVAGVIEPGTVSARPVLYHVHRGHIGEPRGQFALHRDFPDSHFGRTDDYVAALHRGELFGLRNGAIPPFAVVQENVLSSVENLVRNFGFTIPHPGDLRSRERWARLQIGLLCDLLALSDQTQSVGRPLSSLTIAMDGTVRHSPATADLGFV